MLLNEANTDGPQTSASPETNIFLCSPSNPLLEWVFEYEAHTHTHAQLFNVARQQATTTGFRWTPLTKNISHGPSQFNVHTGKQTADSQCSIFHGGHPPLSQGRRASTSVDEPLG
jgi:hypothetical protein